MAWAATLESGQPMTSTRMNTILGSDFKSWSLDQQVVTVLKASGSPLRAADIVSRLDAVGVSVSKSEVNACLYSALSGQVSQDKNYAWTCDQEQSSQRLANSRGSSSLTGEWERFGKILSYYVDCVREDEGSTIRAFLTDVGEKFIPFDAPSEWTGGSIGRYTVSTADFGRFAKSLRQIKNRSALVYGYPMHVDWIERSRNGWTGGFAIPILLQPVEYGMAGGEITFSLCNEWPRVNPAFLEKAFRSAQARHDFLDEIGLLAPDGPPPDDGLTDIVRRVNSIGFPVEPYEEIDPMALSNGIPFAEITGGGIRNRAVIAVTEPSKFTAGLERELEQIRTRASNEKLGQTALRVFFGGAEEEEPEVSARSSDLVEVVPVNDEQRHAVESAFRNRLTVVTGPPGTGKSQVVTNVLANAFLGGESVLFTSRNNKAVDVVEGRLNSLAAVPLLLRAGSKSGDRDLRTELINFINTALSTSTSEADLEDLDARRADVGIALARRKQIAQLIEELRDARNRHEHLDERAVQLRESLYERNLEAIARSGEPAIESLVEAALQAIDVFLRPSAGLFSWLFPRKRQARRAATLDKQLEPIRAVGVLPAARRGDQATLQESEIVDLRDQLSYMAEYSTVSDQLVKARRQLSGHHKTPELAEQMAAAEERLWDAGAELIASEALSIPARMDSAARRDLGAFRATLERLVGDRIGGKAFAELRREQEQLFPRILKLLPAWCVTNLSVGGSIPFSDGEFDLLVIDEASQCDIPSAIPLLYRAKRVMVIGDPMQLSHISSIDSARDQVLQQRHDLTSAHDQPFGYGQNSLFSLAATHASGGQVVNLLDHYRSHADIVGFSNSEWYQDRLRMATDYRRLNRPSGPAVRWTDIKGEARRPQSGAVNEQEADAVVRELASLIESGFSGSVGIVTPFRAQANRIRDLVGSRLSIADIERFDLIVDTAHGFQGDERDVMLFSPVVARGFPNGAKVFLSKTGNLFNVAVTRARSVLHVVGDQNSCASCGIPYVEKFARYCETLGTKQGGGGFEPEVGPWERPLQEALERAGLKPQPQYPVNQYSLDLALPDAAVPIDIEVDGERYHKEWDGTRCRQDVVRDMRLMALGWRVKRFWVYEVRDELDRCVREVLELVERDANDR